MVVVGWGGLGVLSTPPLLLSLLALMLLLLLLLLLCKYLLLCVSTCGTRNCLGAAILAAVRQLSSLSCVVQALSHTLCPC